MDVAPLLASAGIVGVALAFGAQNLIKDFLAGIFMTLEDQYGVGDTVDLGSASGTVTTVGLRTTTLRAGDGTVWHVRNGEVLRVGNASQGEAVVTIDIPLPYDADTARAGAVALAAAESVAASHRTSRRRSSSSPSFRASSMSPPASSPSGWPRPSGRATSTASRPRFEPRSRPRSTTALRQDPRAGLSPAGRSLPHPRSPCD